MKPILELIEALKDIAKALRGEKGNGAESSENNFLSNFLLPDFILENTFIDNIERKILVQFTDTDFFDNDSIFLDWIYSKEINPIDYIGKIALVEGKFLEIGENNIICSPLDTSNILNYDGAELYILELN